MYKYDEEFYRYINEGSGDSASRVLPILLEVLPEPVGSVLDVGCGAGAWLAAWKKLGAQVMGLDGEYVSAEQLLIDGGEFEPTDLRQDFSLGRVFGMVQSLEVAEHLPESAAAGFVKCLCQHSDLVLFSAAPPGQGGENHINEQPYEYWRRLFRMQGFSMYDPIRRRVLSDSTVRPWYRYNSFLYVNDASAESLLSALSSFRISEDETVVDLSPRIYQLRKRLINTLPDGASTLIAILKRKISRLSFTIRHALG